MELTVLLLAHLDRLQSRLDRTQFARYTALDQHAGVKLFGPGRPGYWAGMSVGDATKAAGFDEWPDVILHGVDLKESGVPLVEGLVEVPSLTAIEFQDSWAVPIQQAAFVNSQRFDLALMIVRHHIKMYEQLCPRTEFLWAPHAIDTRLFRDHGLSKNVDVLIYGNLTAHTYPFRARLAQLLRSQVDLRVKIIPHPGYYPSAKDHVVAGEQLSREINRAWITISTSSIFRCVMNKYYEIAASRSLIAGDMPEEGRLTFGNDFLQLDPSWSDDWIIEKVRSILDDKDELMARANAAHLRVTHLHSTDAWSGRLLELLRTLKQDRATRQEGTQVAFYNWPMEDEKNNASRR